MCGRYTLSSPKQLIIEGFLVREWFEDEYPPRYNAAPTQWLPIVRELHGVRRLDLLRWGLIPSWAKDPIIGNRMINARAETVMEKPTYKAAYRRRRCLVPVDGFYEWQALDDGSKQPHLIHLATGELIGLAGLWEHWQSADGTELESFTILTTTPNELLRPIHDRMPVIIPRPSYDAWLSAETPEEALHGMLQPYPAEAMALFPVSRRVGNAKVDDPSLVSPID